MCVVLLLVLTIFWGLSANNVQAQGQNENKGSTGVITDTTNPPPASTAAPGSPVVPTTGTAGAQPPGTPAITITPAAPGTLGNRRPAPGAGARGGYGVMVGSNGQVLEFGEGGGAGLFGIPPTPYNTDEINKARAELMKAQAELRRLGGSISIVGPDPFLIGQPMPGPFDPETRALNEKEHKIAEDVQKITDQYKSSKDKEERAKLKKQIEELAGQQFDIRQQYRGLEVKRLENELARIRDSIQKRTENRDQIIKRHIAQLLHEEEDLKF